MRAIYISRDRSKLKMEEIIKLLQKADWAVNRSEEDVRKSVENSVCYGAFNDFGELIGFARVITDFVTTFYLMDVIVDEPYRSQGIGKKLMDSVMDDVGYLYGILHTDSASRFYERYGFKVTAISDFGEYTMEKPKGGRAEW